ncbi:50S ribosomal protein L9 [candidate division KSB1 bacterium]|nr:50S ribosomal protein L9 [candidate division KSB1 bacterium]
MKIILLKNDDKLGDAGEIVNVKDGYARNFLFPHGLALSATSGNIRLFEEQKKLKAYRETKHVRDAETLANELNKVSCTASVAVGEDDKLFGSVTSQTIADLLKEKGFDIDKRKIVLEEPIKALGIYSVPIKLHSEVEAKIKVWVVKE